MEVEAVRQMFASNGHALAPEQIEQLLTSPQGKHLLRELRMGTGTGGTGTGTGIGGTGIGGPSPAERDGIRRAVFAVLSTVLVAAFVNDAMSAAEKESVGEQAQRQAVVLSAQLEERLYVKSIFIIHVGGTRCVTSSTDNIMKIRARITLTVEFIRGCIFIFLFYV